VGVLIVEQQQANFEGWAIVEMMGHQTEIGFVTTQAFGQAVLFRIDAPELPEREFTLNAPAWADVDGGQHWTQAGAKVKRAATPARSRLVSPNALYAINPCTEQAARTAIEKHVARPLILIEAPPPTAKAIPPPPDELGVDYCADCHEPIEDCKCAAVA
jgi:hypothetical protein